MDPSAAEPLALPTAAAGSADPTAAQPGRYSSDEASDMARAAQPLTERWRIAESRLAVDPYDGAEWDAIVGEAKVRWRLQPTVATDGVRRVALSRRAARARTDARRRDACGCSAASAGALPDFRPTLAALRGC